MHRLIATNVGIGILHNLVKMSKLLFFNKKFRKLSYPEVRLHNSSLD